MPPSSPTCLFVYGTLMRGRANHGLLAGQGAEYVGEDALDGFELRDTGRGYPALVPSDGQRVYGEVFEVPQHAFVALDRLEGVPHLYTRERATTVAGRKVAVYVYARPVAGRPLVAGGRW